MSTENSAALQTAANDRRIESGRLTKALTESMTVGDYAPGMYDIRHAGETYTVDVEGGSCTCKDHQYRGDTVVCKHVLRACIRHAFRAESNSRLVARVLRAVRDAGCPHDVNGCAGPTQLGARGYPCPACVRVSSVGDWVVYQRLVNNETPADAPVAMTDGGRVEDDEYECLVCERTFEELLVMSRHARMTCPENPNADDEEPRGGTEENTVTDAHGDRVPKRSEAPDMGGGESEGVVDLE